MKKAICLFLSVAFLFVGCGRQTEQLIVSEFSKKATVKWKDFSYNCQISYKNNKVEVEVLSTAANGIVIGYDGTSLNISYGEIEISSENKKLNFTNPAIAVYEAISYLNSVSLDTDTLKNGTSAQGECDVGVFTALFDNNSNLIALEFPGEELYIEFKD